MHRRWIIPITFVTGTVIGGLGLTLAGAEINADTVNACINKTSYVVRIRPTSACDATETAGQWVARTDTPAEVLQKIEQVDGQGSGLQPDQHRFRGGQRHQGPLVRRPSVLDGYGFGRRWLLIQRATGVLAFKGLRDGA